MEFFKDYKNYPSSQNPRVKKEIKHSIDDLVQIRVNNQI